MEAFKVSLENIGRRFNREWIFKKVNYTFENNQSYGILGPNGSGKSTLLQLISGSLTQSEGKLSYQYNCKEVSVEDVFKHLVIAAPYLELIEEFTLQEIITFHFKFKSYRNGLTSGQLIDLLALKAVHKPLKYFSSGMKQRVKLALAFASDTPVLLLDEPTANLDQQGIDWYLSLIDQYTTNRLVLVCSNQPHEYQFCQHQLNVLNYKL